MNPTISPDSATRASSDHSLLHIASHTWCRVAQETLDSEPPHTDAIISTSTAASSRVAPIEAIISKASGIPLSLSPCLTRTRGSHVTVVFLARRILSVAPPPRSGFFSSESVARPPQQQLFSWTSRGGNLQQDAAAGRRPSCHNVDNVALGRSPVTGPSWQLDCSAEARQWPTT